MGRWLLSARRGVPRLAGATLLGALTFWTISNLGNWWLFYPHDGAGLLANYASALPYLLRSLLGDALYVALLFGVAGAAIFSFLMTLQLIQAIPAVPWQVFAGLGVAIVVAFGEYTS